ncbi:MAG TPA: trigger factor [Acidimicrobiia bacterium]|jgi:trigger factor
MSVSVREAGPFERLIEFELTEAEIDAAKTAAARRLAKDLKLKGFRPGKAPRPVVEAAVGKERLRSEAIEDAIPPKLSEVLRGESLRPAVNPELERIEDIEGGVSVEIKVTLWPTLESPPPYQDRKIEVDSPEVSDEELETQLERMREQFGQVEEAERPAEEGDFVSLDITPEVDGQPLEEGSAKELLYRIGSGGLIEGADEALVGAAAGQEITIDAPLPEGFGERAGEQATFRITVNEVKELVLPELTDEWVDENTEYETVEELRTSLRERMVEVKRAGAARRFADRALETLVDQVELEIPQAVLRAEMDEILHRFLHRLEDQQLTLSDYFQATGMSQEQFLADLESQADRSLRTRILLDAIIADASLEVDDSEVEAVLQRVAVQTDDPEAFMRSIRGTPQELAVRADILRDKALKLIIDNATPVDPDGNPIELDLDDEAEQMSVGEVVGEVVEGEAIEDGVVEGEIVEGELIEDSTAQVPGGEAAPDEEVSGEPNQEKE